MGELCHIRPVLVEQDRMEDRFIEGEGLDCTEISRPLDRHMVPGIYQHLAEQVEALLGAVGDQDLVRRYYEPETFFVPVRDVTPERQVSFRSRVLECGTSVLCQDRSSCPGNAIDIDKPRVRESPGKGDDLWVFGYLEDLTDERFWRLCHPRCKPVLPAGTGAGTGCRRCLLTHGSPDVI